MQFHINKTLLLGIFFSCALTLGLGCSSAPNVKTQAYARLKNERTYENDFPTVWKSIEATLRNHRITQRDPRDVDALEMKKLTRRSLNTDWIYGQSRDKYQEYQVNGTPRKVYLQTRFKYFVDAQRVMGGVNVKVDIEEEIEKLKSDGAPEGYSSVKEPDSSRASEFLDKVQQGILAAPNT